jgi:hypothetical protein
VVPLAKRDKPLTYGRVDWGGHTAQTWSPSFVFLRALRGLILPLQHLLPAGLELCSRLPFGNPFALRYAPTYLEQ